MKIGTPRPPKKDGAIKFQYGRYEGSLDFIVLYGNDVPRCDRALVMNLFTSKFMGFDYAKRKPTFDDSFIDELKSRGYDTSTIKFSIERLKDSK
jgi:hypothetical protein